MRLTMPWDLGGCEIQSDSASDLLSVPRFDRVIGWSAVSGFCLSRFVLCRRLEQGGRHWTGNQSTCAGHLYWPNGAVND